MPTTDQLIAELIGQPQVGWPDELADRLQNHLPVADRHLRHLYGHRDDYPEVIKDIGRVVIQGAVDRVPALREADVAGSGLLRRPFCG
jgi:hypothetical protein